MNFGCRQTSEIDFFYKSSQRLISIFTIIFFSSTMIFKNCQCRCLTQAWIRLSKILTMVMLFRGKKLRTWLFLVLHKQLNKTIYVATSWSISVTSKSKCKSSIVSQQTRWINVETTLISNVHQRCFIVDIWLKMTVALTYIYRHYFNVSKTDEPTLFQR